ncbi:hypothetical protein [Micromonospora rubida]
MTTLIIGNSRTWEMVGDLTALTPGQLRGGACVAQRMLWFAQDGIRFPERLRSPAAAMVFYRTDRDAIRPSPREIAEAPDLSVR